MFGDSARHHEGRKTVIEQKEGGWRLHNERSLKIRCGVNSARTLGMVGTGEVQMNLAFDAARCDRDVTAK